jgi:hypothetical protein
LDLTANMLLVDILGKRTELLNETYEFIKNLILTLVGECYMSMRVICVGLKRRGVDLSQPKVPENFSPELLLKSLTAVLKEPPLDLEGEIKPQPKRTNTSGTFMSVMTKTPHPAGARVGGLGKANIGAYIAAKFARPKEQSNTTPPPVPSPEEDEFLKKWSSSIVPVLSDKIQVFRDSGFKGLELEEYTELRGNHILLHDLE